MNRELWNVCDYMRGLMNIRDTERYVLSFKTYKKLSDDFEKRVIKELPTNVSYEQAWSNEMEYQQYIFPISQQLGYEVEPDYLFSKFVKQVKEGDIRFDVTIVAKAFSSLENSATKYNSHSAFAHLFDEVDLMSQKLGRTNNERTAIISKIIIALSKEEASATDFEETIDSFATYSGRQGGENYSPVSLSKLLAKIVTLDKTRISKVYDPACGTGLSLLEVGRVIEVEKYFGQEINVTTYNLARMNMLMHDVNYRQFDIQVGDSLLEPKHHETFDAIVSVPPFSANWQPDKVEEDDPRFIGYGKLAPKSKADFAFIQHMLYHLDDNGTMAIIVPHGVLFRGAAEGVIRKYIIEQQNYLDAVISLPSNLFYTTGIPTCLLVFKKQRQHDSEVLFIDASNDYQKERKNNVLSDKHIQQIVDTYVAYKTTERYARVVTIDEIRNNDFNLNIPRYVDTTEEEPVVDVEAIETRLLEVKEELTEIDLELQQLIKRLNEY